MSNDTPDKKEFLTDKAFATPNGKKVKDAFFNTLSETGDFGKAAKKATQVAKELGMLAPLGIYASIDFLRLFGPLLIQAYRLWMSKSKSKSKSKPKSKPKTKSKSKSKK